MHMEYLIKMTWDPEASVWIATSDDISGLTLESVSFRALIGRVSDAIPDLLGVYIQSNDLSILVKCSDYIAGTSMERDRL